MTVRHIIISLFILATLLLPAAPAFADHCRANEFAMPLEDGRHECITGGEGVTTVSVLLGRITAILNTFIPFIIGLAVFVILWGIFRYITQAAEEEKRAEARQYIIYGIVGVFLMLSVWGFVNILVNTFALDKTIKLGDIPKVPPFSTFNEP